MSNKLPPVMKKGCWESGPKNFGSFEFKGEIITIDTEEKYFYWADKIDINKDDEDIKYLLDFIYNPYITTGISDKKLGKVIDKNSPRFIEREKAQSVFSQTSDALSFVSSPSGICLKLL